MKPRLLLRFILVSATVVSAKAAESYGSPVGRATIAAPGSSIVQAADGRRVLLFREDAESIQFTGRMRGLSPARARYYWTFEGGQPARYPDQGVLARLNPCPVKYAGPGEACLHVVDRKEPGRVLAEAKLAIGHVAFEFQQQPGGDPADPIFNRIPEGAVVGPNDEIFVQANVVIKTDPPLPGVDLGRLTFEHPHRDRLAPDRVITDTKGSFSTR